MTSATWREAPVRRELAATLLFLEKLTLRPRELDAADVLAARAAGVEQIDLEHAIIVCSLFNAMNRLVDAFGADLTVEQAPRVAAALHAFNHLTPRSGTGPKDPPLGPSFPAFAVSLWSSIRTGDGDAPATIRAGVEARVAGALGLPRPALELPALIADFADRVGSDVHSLSDGDFERLRSAGWCEEAIYELVFVGAAAAGLGRLEVGWKAIAAAAPR